MYSLFLGAGYSKWAVNLPLVNELFDLNIGIFNKTDSKRIELVKSLKFNWDKENPKGNDEKFITYALNLPIKQKKAVLWYITRRLAEPFIWEEFHSQRWRRHVLMIDEYRKWQVNGLREASSFLQGFAGFSLAGIITTNYDMVIEYALGTKNFNYGVMDQVLSGRGAYPVSTWRKPVILTGEAKLVKIHGSISWDENNFYTDGRRGITGNALIVPPTERKQFPESVRQIWQLAVEILEQTRQLLVFGFAFNTYDQTVYNLLMSHGGNIESVLLVDIKPNLDTVKKLWPKASITWCQPPPDGNDVIRLWKGTLP